MKKLCMRELVTIFVFCFCVVVLFCAFSLFPSILKFVLFFQNLCVVCFRFSFSVFCFGPAAKNAVAFFGPPFGHKNGAKWRGFNCQCSPVSPHFCDRKAGRKKRPHPERKNPCTNFSWFVDRHPREQFLGVRACVWRVGMSVSACVCECMRACVHVRIGWLVRACMRACVHVC